MGNAFFRVSLDFAQMLRFPRVQSRPYFANFDCAEYDCEAKRDLPAPDIRQGFYPHASEVP